jgi:hypothetical protein
MLSSSSSEPRKQNGRLASSTTTTKKSTDAFADDPFFEEFSRSVRRPILGGGNGGVVNVGLLRRNRRETFGATTIVSMPMFMRMSINNYMKIISLLNRTILQWKNIKLQLKLLKERIQENVEPYLTLALFHQMR